MTNEEICDRARHAMAFAYLIRRDFQLSREDAIQVAFPLSDYLATVPALSSDAWGSIIMAAQDDFLSSGPRTPERLVSPVLPLGTE